MSMKTFAPNLSVFFRFELLRILGAAPSGGSEISEVLEAAEQIKQDDPEVWYGAWAAAAERAEDVAQNCASRGDREAARYALLRATNYWRASEFMLHVKRHDPRLLSCLERTSLNFERACSLMDDPVKKLKIPYEGTTLPGYLFLPPQAKDGSKVPLLLVTGGYDSVQEELWYAFGPGARRHGFACIVFEGPGQGVVVRRSVEQGRRHLRPDWEVVISAVLDHVHSIAADFSIDTSRIALSGASMGGYFAMRAAGSDSRIAAAISIDGFYDLGELARAQTPSFLRPENAGDGIFNRFISAIQWLNFQARFEFQHGMLAMGVETPADVYREIEKYRLRDGDGDGSELLARVKCPVLVTGSRDTLYWTPERSAVRIMEGLSQLKDGQDKSLWLPVGWGQGSLQAKVGAWSHLQDKMFGWLIDVFEINRQAVELKGLS